jgi:Ca2+-binding EF-hand superfamily protein
MGYLITEDQRVAVETQGIAGLLSNLMATFAANHARILDFFRDADTNADGCISKNEMRFALFNLGMNASPSDVHQPFGMLDKDGNGVLQFGELQDALLA